jgi:hypothetical protein
MYKDYKGAMASIAMSVYQRVDGAIFRVGHKVNALWASGCHESKALSCEDLGQAWHLKDVRVQPPETMVIMV